MVSLSERTAVGTLRILGTLGVFGLLGALTSCDRAADMPVQDLAGNWVAEGLYAPWDGLENGTKLYCCCDEEYLYFNYTAQDCTLVIDEERSCERVVDDEDRIEIFFCPDKAMKQYYAAEIDPLGRIMDYSAHYYRDLDFSWGFKTMTATGSFIRGGNGNPSGYEVSGRVSLEELRSLGIPTDGSTFYLGVFQADFHRDGTANWYSRVPTGDKSPDFHKPDVLFPAKITPSAAAMEYRGVVLYPSDITSLGLEQWRKRIDLSGINLIALHSATFNEPLDTLKQFLASVTGQEFLKMCKEENVDVEYELHVLQSILPRELFDEHPEYFRMDSTGHRVQAHNMCFTCEEAYEAIRPQVEELMGWLHPTTHRYFLWTDDITGAFCNCENCRKFSPSEQALIYEKHLLEMIREYDSEATIAHLAYFQTLMPPEKVSPSEGIFLEYAPISRDYTKSLSRAHIEALEGNLKIFPPLTTHILEYWLDESMFCGWKKDSLVPLPFHKEDCRRDIALYRSFGIKSITCFATWLNAAYVSRFGPADDAFKGYGDASLSLKSPQSGLSK